VSIERERKFKRREIMREMERQRERDRQTDRKKEYENWWLALTIKTLRYQNKVGRFYNVRNG